MGGGRMPGRHRKKARRPMEPKTQNVKREFCLDPEELRVLDRILAEQVGPPGKGE